MKNNAKAIIAVNIESGERRDFSSINEAARFLGVQFQTVQTASYRNGSVKGWRIYPSQESIRRQIELLECQLKEIGE